MSIFFVFKVRKLAHAHYTFFDSNRQRVENQHVTRLRLFLYIPVCSTLNIELSNNCSTKCASCSPPLPWTAAQPTRREMKKHTHGQEIAQPDSRTGKRSGDGTRGRAARDPGRAPAQPRAEGGGGGARRAPPNAGPGTTAQYGGAQGRDPRRNTGAGDAPGPRARPRGAAHAHPIRRTPDHNGGATPHNGGDKPKGRETKRPERKTRAAASVGPGPGQAKHRRRRLPHTEPEGRAAENKETTHRRGAGAPSGAGTLYADPR